MVKEEERGGIKRVREKYRAYEQKEMERLTLKCHRKLSAK